MHHSILAFVAELQKLGFIEGQNLTVDRHGYGLPVERFAEVAQDHVKAHVDAILCGGEAAARAAQGATRTVPLVVLVDDAVRAALVRSLAKPGGNTTGVSILASELDGKRQDILIEAVPVGLVDPGSTTAVQAKTLVQSAGVRGVELSIHQVTKPEEIAPPSTLRRLRARPHLMCWPRRFFSIIARSFSSASQLGGYPRFINGRKWLRTKVSSDMVLALSKSMV